MAPYGRDRFPSRDRLLLITNFVLKKRGTIQVITFGTCFRWGHELAPCHSTACILPSDKMISPMLLIQQNNCVAIVDLYAESMAPVSPGMPGRIFELSCGVLGQAAVSVL